MVEVDVVPSRYWEVEDQLQCLKRGYGTDYPEQVPNIVVLLYHVRYSGKVLMDSTSLRGLQLVTLPTASSAAYSPRDWRTEVRWLRARTQDSL